MRRQHFEELAPLCPGCRAETTAHRLEIGSVARGDQFVVEEVLLLCTNPACRREFPIIDGIPIIIAGLRDFICENHLHFLTRDDLSLPVLSLMGDCFGPGTAFDQIRHFLSGYGWGHYGDLDRSGLTEAPRHGVAALTARALELVGDAPSGLTIDMGCSVGRTSIELAKVRDGLVLGIDVNMSMLRCAQAVLRDGVARFPLRRVGVVYDEAEIPVEVVEPERIDFWCCDATALPFAPRTFALATSTNLLDCVKSPLTHLLNLDACLIDGGRGWIATPYDWSDTATPAQAWLGGYSQRAEFAGRSEPLLRRLLTAGAHPSGCPRLSIIGEDEGVPWRVRLSERGASTYELHLLAVEAAGTTV